ncbi:hypothetical protein ACFXP3_34965, partial [Streptomyces sp. NPDC059096]
PHDDPYDSYENYDHYENAGAARDRPGARSTDGSRAPGVSVEIVGDGTGASGADRTDPGGLTVEARPAGATTLITLRASGGERVSWTAGTRAPWISLSRHYGTLAPGESVTVRVFVDPAREPAGPWSARIALYPAGAAVRIHGYGTRPPLPGRPDHSGRPGDPADPGPARPTWTAPTAVGSPSAPGSADPTGGPEPSGPGPEGSGSPSQSPPDPDPPDPDPATSSAAAGSPAAGSGSAGPGPSAAPR